MQRKTNVGNPKIGRGPWRKSTDTVPSNSPTTNGSAVTKAAKMEAPLSNEPESPFIDMSATATERIVISNELQTLPSSVNSILNPGSELTAWNLPPQNFIDSATSLETIDVTAYPFDERQRRRLDEFAFGIGLTPALAIGDICHFLREAGFDVYSGTLREAVEFYLDNYWYGP